MSETDEVSEEILNAANAAFSNLIPEKSKKFYELTYRKFMKWRERKQCRSFNEDVFGAYFGELAKDKKPSTLWAQYSMLRAMLVNKNNIDISKYLNLRAFLKRKSDGYHPKKSNTFSKEQIIKFINEAPDHVYLLTKVIQTLWIYISNNF